MRANWYDASMPKRILPATILAAYSAVVMAILVLKIASFRIGHVRLNFSGYATGEPNLIPLTSILPYLRGDRGAMIALFNIGGNIVLFVPIGFLLPFVVRHMTWRTALVVAIIAPLAIEVTQLVCRVGIFDIDDVILNGIGIMIGYALYVVFSILRRFH